MPPRKTKESAASPKKEKAPKKEKVKKDPNAPKKPSGAYIFFCNDHRAEVKKANPEFGVAESGRELGAMWKSATDEDKKKYYTQAEKDKERYSKQAAAYAKKVESEKDDEDTKEEAEADDD